MPLEGRHAIAELVRRGLDDERRWDDRADVLIGQRPPVQRLQRGALRSGAVPVRAVGLACRLAQRFAEGDDVRMRLDVAESGAGPVVERVRVFGDAEQRLVDGRKVRLVVVDERGS